MEDLDWYISQAGDDIHLIEKFEAEDSYDLYEALELDELAAPGAPPVVKGTKKLEVTPVVVGISTGPGVKHGLSSIDSIRMLSLVFCRATGGGCLARGVAIGDTCVHTRKC